MQGIIKFFDKNKFYGFIVADDGKGDVFFHGNDCHNINGTPEKGARLRFDVEVSDKGRQASNIEVLDEGAVMHIVDGNDRGGWTRHGTMRR
jgi:cold shock protein